MIGDMTDYRECGYEVDHEGKFWNCYVYKKTGENEYELVRLIRFMSEPTEERIHESIDNEVYGEW